MNDNALCKGMYINSYSEFRQLLYLNDKNCINEICINSIKLKGLSNYLTDFKDLHILRDFKNLHILKIYGSAIVFITEEFCNFKKLKTLVITYSKLKYIPNSIINLIKLKFFSINKNNLIKIEPFIFKMKNLDFFEFVDKPYRINQMHIQKNKKDIKKINFMI